MGTTDIGRPTAPLHIGAVWRDMVRLASERRAILLGYLAAAIIIPYLFFAIFPQATMRGFAALLLNRGMAYSAETPMTAVSLFIIALWAMTACLFAYWSAVLAESREEITSEVMTGAILALLVVPVMLIIGLAALLIVPMISTVALSIAPNTALGRLSTLASLTLLGVTIARCVLAGPIMAARGSINPFLGLIESWRMTRGVLGKALLLVLPVYFVAFIMVIGFLGGATAVLMATDGSGWHDMGLTILWLLIEIALLTLAMLLPAALYRTLSPAVDADIFS